jgi:hypothetical protein
VAVWNRLNSLIFGGAIGAAARTAIEPQIEPARQLAWKNNKTRILELEPLAELVAEGALDEADVEDWVARNGYDVSSLRALTEIALRAPDLGLLMRARRRGELTPEEFNEGLSKLRVKPEFRKAIRALLDDHLSAEVVALAIVRGLIPDPGILPVSPPTGPGSVPSFPVFDVDAVDEARGDGLDLERLSVLTGLAGRPMSPEAAAEAHFKGILELVDYQRAVSESDVRNEWRDALLENQRFRLRPADWAGLWLRGWVDEAEAIAGGADYGASPETMRRLYQNRGRPATGHQVHIGYARGGKHAGSANEREAFDTAIKQSDIRVEWAELLWEGRYTYPSAFVVRALASSGAFDHAATLSILLEMGWPPKYAELAADAFTGGTAGAASSKWLGRARSTLFTRVHTEYVSRQLTHDEAVAGLTAASVPAAEAEAVVDLWSIESDLIRTELTQAQIVKAWKKGYYSDEEALAELVERGMTEDDARIRLGSG